MSLQRAVQMAQLFLDEISIDTPRIITIALVRLVTINMTNILEERGFKIVRSYTQRR